MRAHSDLQPLLPPAAPPPPSSFPRPPAASSSPPPSPTPPRPPHGAAATPPPPSPSPQSASSPHQTPDGPEEELARLRAEVERLRASQGRRGEQLRRLMTELKAVRAGRAGAESAFEQLNEAVAGLRREEERRADQAVAERDRARAELENQRAATAAAEARAELEARRADMTERQLNETQERLARLEQEQSGMSGKLAEEQQRADRVLIHNLQLASRVRQLEQELQEGGSAEARRGSRDVESNAGGADGATSGTLLAHLREMWNLRDRKGMMVITVLTLLIFWYLSSYS